MLNKVVFENEIHIYWDKIFKIDNKLYFEVFLNGKLHGKAEFTHYEFKNLTPKTEYKIAVNAIDKEDGSIYRKYPEITVKTANAKNVIDITKPPYNAVGDGKTDNTKALQQALNDCTDKDKVFVPAGVFVIGAVDMHSNTELYIDKGGVLLGSTHREDYLPKRISRFEGYELERYSAMINAGKIDNSCKKNCKNIIIRGEGEIRGGGLELSKSVMDYEMGVLQDYIKELGDKLKKFDRVEVIPGRQRPFLIDINNCENVVITGLKIGYGACWNVHYCYCTNVIVSSCEISSEIQENGKSIGIWNGDGIDPDSSDNCVIYDIKFCTHDDSIAIKSGKNPEGNIVGVPCTNIRIFHTYGEQGIAIGSELSGGIENVYIWDIVIQRSSRGIRVKTTRDRGGYVKNMMVSNASTPAFSIDTFYNCNGDGEPAPTLTKLENFYYENVNVTGKCTLPFPGITLFGYDVEENAIKNVTLRNVTVHGTDSTVCQELKIDGVKGLTLDNFKVTPIKD